VNCVLWCPRVLARHTAPDEPGVPILLPARRFPGCLLNNPKRAPVHGRW